ncbi:hypothetical protein TNCV_3049691 [Trichonephila clavipes]|nr:hypothetical protein TNCV_3049691 [Trichonephila clavipes]
MTLGARFLLQMFGTSGQSDAKTPVFSLVFIYRPTEGMKCCLNPSRGLNPGPVAWKRDTLIYNDVSLLLVQGYKSSAVRRSEVETAARSYPTDCKTSFETNVLRCFFYIKWHWKLSS